jgi:hypothetical protein
MRRVQPGKLAADHGRPGVIAEAIARRAAPARPVPTIPHATVRRSKEPGLNTLVSHPSPPRQLDARHRCICAKPGQNQRANQYPYPSRAPSPLL